MVEIPATTFILWLKKTFFSLLLSIAK